MAVLTDNPTQGQLALFETVPNDYAYIESILHRLPRKRQQEHFRKLYLTCYHAVKDDGSVAYACGNLQRRVANTYLRDLLDVRLKKVFAHYRCDVSWLLTFSRDPNWALDMYMKIEFDEKKVTVPTAKEIQIDADDLASIKPKSKAASKRERQKTAIPFYLLTETKLKEIAYKLVQLFGEFQQSYFVELAEKQQTSGVEYDEKSLNKVTLELYRLCGERCAEIGFPIEHWQRFQQKKQLRGDYVDIALNKIVSEKYWFRVMRKKQNQMIEHIAIACGEVRKQTASYISHHGFNQWKEQMKKNYDFLRNQIIENVSDPDEQAELFEMFLKSSANPALRRTEMMVRLRGIEEWAEESGHQALFLTLTAPSAFHSVHSSGENNEKWNGASPKETHQYLNTVWQQFRALLAKRGIKMYGTRVAEPHHDATPHWHLLAYVHQNNVDEFVRLFQQKALELDGDELGAKKHRCKVEFCDKEKGTPTGYIAKYIAKNIDGFADDSSLSDEGDFSLKENSRRARAWASLWGIRQFQFYGDQSIGVWRELRRLVNGCCDDELIEKAIAVADVGCYASLLKLQGGPMIPRKEQPIKLSYDVLDENQFGEQRKKIVGIRNVFSLVGTVFSRLKQWLIKRKPQDWDFRKQSAVERSEAVLNGEPAPPWTCVSNCNHTKIKQQVTIQKLNNKCGQIGCNFIQKVQYGKGKSNLEHSTSG